MLETDIKTLQDRFKQGHYISKSGVELSFKINRSYSRSELESHFYNFGIPKETDYFEFLEMFGACDIFGRYSGKESKTRVLIELIEFFPVESLIDINASISEALPSNISRFFLVAYNTYTGYFFGFDLDRNTDTFGVFTVDSYPEDWREDTESWYDFSEWLNLLLKTDGKKARPR